MHIYQEVQTRQRSRIRIWASSAGLVFTLLAFIGMVHLTPDPFVSQQGGLQRVRRGDSLHFPIDFATTPSGNFQNEGWVWFQADITNNGRMGCGSCRSGMSLIQREDGKSTLIRGYESLTMYEVLVDQEAEVRVETEWKIKHQLQLKEGHIRSDKAKPDEGIHFLEQATCLPSPGTYIDGWIKKSGEGAFCFPLGNDKGLKRVWVEGSHPGSKFQATYLNPSERQNLNILTGIPLYRSETGHPFPHAGLWLIEGNDSTYLTFELPEDEETTALLGWKNGKWEVLGALRETRGIRTSTPIRPDDYEAFTLGL